MRSSLTYVIEKTQLSHPCSITVIGDVMLDRYIYGTVERISPEAPIPVLNFKSERTVLGGAGNVVANLCGLGAKVTFISRIGSDEAGQKAQILTEGLNKNTRGEAYFVPLYGAITTCKTRIVGNGRQQMLRLDREETAPLTAEQVDSVWAMLQERLAQGTDAVILSDYAKGVCSESLCRRVIEASGACGVPVFVDPKGKDWQRYRGAELVTPNIKELSDAIGRAVTNESDEEIIRTANELRKQYELQNVLVTRSEKGSTFIGAHDCFHTQSRAAEVFDVSGAGDTMIATAAYFHALGLVWEDCCELANIAAQVVIAKAGTYAVSFDELKKAVREREMLTTDYPRTKLFTLSELVAKVFEWRNAGETIVFTNGCFDVFHAGHLDSLLRARVLGDHLIVALNSDVSVRKLKGDGRPVNSQRDRAAVLSALSCVDAVVIFDEDTPERVLSVLRPDILVKGGDYREDQIAGRQYAGKVVLLPLVEGISSTEILQKIRQNND